MLVRFLDVNECVFQTAMSFLYFGCLRLLGFKLSDERTCTSDSHREELPFSQIRVKLGADLD